MGAAPYYSDAQAVAHFTGWLPEVVYTQWVVETDHFKSEVFLVDHNPAGITWYEGCGKPQGLPRPASEGGYYIHFNNAVDGYIWFIKNNSRYGNVKDAICPEEAFTLLQRDGWATDPNYVTLLNEVYNELKAQGVFADPAPQTRKQPIVPFPGVNFMYKRPFMEGPNVSRIQRALNFAAGHEVVTVDGIYGPLTAQAVKEYQRSHGLVDDGIVGVHTWNMMF